MHAMCNNSPKKQKEQEKELVKLIILKLPLIKGSFLFKQENRIYSKNIYKYR